MRMRVNKNSPAVLARFPLLSFFTGGGLLDIGFIDAGFPIVWHNECDQVVADGYEYAIAHYCRTEKDATVARIQNRTPIQDVEAATIAREAFGDAGKPELFGIIGGPPCPDFSSAGRHEGKDGKNGFLLETYVSRIISLKPVFFLLENVPGLLRIAKHRDYLSALLQRLEREYAVDANVLNALNFGVPQDRNRVFVLGFRRDWLLEERELAIPRQGEGWGQSLEALKRRMFRDPRADKGDAELHWFPWPHDGRYHGAKWQYAWPQTSPFGEQPEKPTGIPDELMVWTQIGDTEHLESLPNGKDAFTPHSAKFETVAEGDVKGKSFKRLHRWRFSPTAAYGNREVHLHPSEKRRLTVREAMRIQSVPDEYALPEEMPLGAKFKVISNGVPVKLATVLAKQIASFLGPESSTGQLP